MLAETAAFGLLVPECIISSVVSVLVLTFTISHNKSSY